MGNEHNHFINIAEAFGFILGKYTIPPDMPIIYITDSNNARTLQGNVKFRDKFTHHKMIRCVKQGINHAIANDLEYLTYKWPRDEQLTRYTLELYKRGEETYKLGAKQKQDTRNGFFSL
jgi:hypothetical protein